MVGLGERINISSRWRLSHSPYPVFFKDRGIFQYVSVCGDVLICSQLKVLVKVGNIGFQQDNCQGNPVLAYLQRHGTPQGLPIPLANEGYTLRHLEGSSTFNAPLTNEPYSKVSGDFNPIHVNPYFSDHASLPTMIIHGMGSSAATRCYVENVAAQGYPNRVLANVSFVGMVLPNDQLEVKPKHNAVWDGADAHLFGTYGFSIGEFVRDNPKETSVALTAINRRWLQT